MLSTGNSENFLKPVDMTLPGRGQKRGSDIETENGKKSRRGVTVHLPTSSPRIRARSKPRKRPRSVSVSTRNTTDGTSITQAARRRTHVFFSNQNTDPVVEIPEIVGATQTLAAGDGELGQLGLGPDNPNGKSRFVAVKELALSSSSIQFKPVACAAGALHSLVLTDTGHVFSFGCNDEGALGRETEEETGYYVPRLVDLPPVLKIARVAAGNVHSMALTTTGRVFFWGLYRDSKGPMGAVVNGNTNFQKPTEVLMHETIIDISCGADHSLLLSRSGNVYSMGCSEQGRLGRIRRSHCCRENRRANEVMLVPHRVHAFHQRKPVVFDRIWTGRFTSFARSAEDGSIWGCGLNNFSQLGDMKDEYMEDSFVYTFVRLEAFDPSIKWTQIAGGEQHTLALDDSGNVYALGRRVYGRLGLGKVQEDSDVKMPTSIETLHTDGHKIIAIAAGDHTSFALDNNGTLYSWGQGSDMLGQGDRNSATDLDVFEPTACISNILRSSKVVSLSAGSSHSLCIVTVPER